MNSSNSSAAEPSSNIILVESLEDISIPSHLKYLLTNLKNIIPVQLTAENHPIWRSQVLKVFASNRFNGFLDDSLPKPAKATLNDEGTLIPNPQHTQWLVADQNLAAALYCIISPSILPYVLNLDTCYDIWQTIDKRLQSTNRSRVLQLKNELQHFTVKNVSMTQYLSLIKSKVDALNAVGCSLDAEDVILHTLNGLPSSYHAFKTSIRTKLHPISLDDFYSLLCTEEINLANEALKGTHIGESSDQQMTFNTYRGRGCGRSSPNIGRNSFSGGRTITYRGAGYKSVTPIECQICLKCGHSAATCWTFNLIMTINKFQLAMAKPSL